MFHVLLSVVFYTLFSLVVKYVNIVIRHFIVCLLWYCMLYAVWILKYAALTTDTDTT